MLFNKLFGAMKIYQITIPQITVLPKICYIEFMICQSLTFPNLIFGINWGSTHREFGKNWDSTDREFNRLWIRRIATQQIFIAPTFL